MAMAVVVVAIAVAVDGATEFEMACVNDKDEKVSETFMMSEEDLARTMRLTHAFTYYSSQARTRRELSGVSCACATKTIGILRSAP